MKKKKPKKSPSKSPSNSQSPPPPKNPSTEKQNPPGDNRGLDASMVVSDAPIDPRAEGDAQQSAEIKDSPPLPKLPSTEVPNSPGKDQLLVESKAVSDAPIVSQAEKDAQQSGADRLISDNQKPNPTKTVIDTSVSDPSTEGQGLQYAPIESYSDRVPSTEGLEATVPPQLAIAEAKMISLSSQEANVALVPAGAKSIVVAEPALSVQDEEHVLAKCPLRPKEEQTGRKTRRGKSKERVKEKDKVHQQWREIVPTPTASEIVVDQAAEASENPAPTPQKEKVRTEISHQSKLGKEKDKVIGESSGTPYYLRSVSPRKGSASPKSSNSELQPDSSDVDTTDSDLEEGELSLSETPPSTQNRQL
ncbi:hypothetical protein F2Q69_00008184 [Brassica cretica]|uniref:Uncharacterized protein n=1 Tax=Brassica cretica TaxID=69181 RepID=A0A8S9NQH5_BRACR|nr:hypothetical protein F2Q69_00008184 [Brassica cretica]